MVVKLVVTHFFVKAVPGSPPRLRQCVGHDLLRTAGGIAPGPTVAEALGQAADHDTGPPAGASALDPARTHRPRHDQHGHAGARGPGPTTPPTTFPDHDEASRRPSPGHHQVDAGHAVLQPTAPATTPKPGHQAGPQRGQPAGQAAGGPASRGWSATSTP